MYITRSLSANQITFLRLRLRAPKRLEHLRSNYAGSLYSTPVLGQILLSSNWMTRPCRGKHRIPPLLLPLWRIPDTITRQVFRPDSSRDSSTCSTSSSFPFIIALFFWSVRLFYNNFNQKHYFQSIAHLQWTVDCVSNKYRSQVSLWSSQLGLSIGVDTTTPTIPSLLQHSFFKERKKESTSSESYPAGQEFVFLNSTFVFGLWSDFRLCFTLCRLSSDTNTKTFVSFFV